MLQYPSGQLCLVIEPGQGGSQVNLPLLPQDPLLLSTGPHLPGGASSFYQVLTEKGGWGKKAWESVGGRGMRTCPQNPVPTQPCPFQMIFASETKVNGRPDLVDHVKVGGSFNC